jgi:hypothetical protein
MNNEIKTTKEKLLKLCEDRASYEGFSELYDDVMHNCFDEEEMLGLIENLTAFDDFKIGE